eukprot:TRINITY_DN1176_c0_g1_i1.p1 TRINITY_DN1176_c0_g1~~TRINITY_DN1176_c0_g1_i1.p1  ORF type:complete len:232 (-),score=37.06 TRINITY_DN1176_c0_g1_i1:67-762(-)
MVPKKLACVLFDIDGTLVETDTTHRLIFAEIMKPFGYIVDEFFYKRHITGRLNPDIFREFLPRHYSDKQIQEFADYKENLFRQKAQKDGRLRPLPGLILLLEELRHRNIKCACVTNAPKENAEMMLEALNVKEYFEFVVLGDDCEFGKPHPAPYLKALEKFQVSPDECIVFEDSPSGIKSATAANIKTIGIASTQEPQFLQSFSGVVHAAPDFSQLDVEFMQHLLQTPLSA